MAAMESYFTEIDVKETVLGERYYLVFNCLKTAHAGYTEVNGIMAFPISTDSILLYVNEYLEGLAEEVLQEDAATTFFPEVYMVERTESDFIPSDEPGEFLVIVKAVSGSDYRPTRYYVYNCMNTNEVMDYIETELSFRKHMDISEVVVFKCVGIELHYQIGGLFDAEECEAELAGKFIDEDYDA